MEIQFFPSKTCIIDQFWHICSHLQSDQLFAKTCPHAIIFYGKNWMSIFGFPLFSGYAPPHTHRNTGSSLWVLKVSVSVRHMADVGQKQTWHQLHELPSFLLSVPRERETALMCFVSRSMYCLRIPVAKDNDSSKTMDSLSISNVSSNAM